jgi:hypothetical protein
MKIGMIALLGAAVLGLALVAKKTTTPATAPVNELPGYTFPEPGTVGNVTGPGGEIVATNYVTGTAQQAYENAQEILAKAAAAAPTLIRSYNDVRQYDTNAIKVPGGYMDVADFYNPETGEYLNITPYGWVVFKQDWSTLSPSGWAAKRGQTVFSGLTKELPGWLT